MSVIIKMAILAGFFLETNTIVIHTEVYCLTVQHLHADYIM